MQLDRQFTVAVAPDAVWAAFHDPALLVSCLPGASLRGEPEGDRLPLLFKVKLGPIAAAFSGEGTVGLDDAARSGVFAGQATDGKSNSRVKGEARFALAPEGDGTRVQVAVSFTIAGSLAQFSREGIVRALADQLTRQFAANLQAALDAQAPAAAAVPQAPAGAQPAPATTPGLLDSAAEAAASPRSPSPDVAPAAGPAAMPPRPQPRPAGGEAPALDVFALLAAVIRGYWHRLTRRSS